MLKPAIDIFDEIGGCVIFVGEVMRTAWRSPCSFESICRQIWKVTIQSLPTTAMAGFFVGAIMTVQFTMQIKGFGALGFLGGLSTSATVREIGPLLIAFLLSGKVGAFTSAELGTMRVTEQIDALRALSTNPFKYLVAPRILAGIIMMPFLVLIADIIGVLGGYLVSVYSLGFSPGPYVANTFKFLETIDVVSGLVKAGFFGFIIAVMGCYFGYNSQRGAEGDRKSVV